MRVKFYVEKFATIGMMSAVSSANSKRENVSVLMATLSVVRNVAELTEILLKDEQCFFQ